MANYTKIDSEFFINYFANLQQSAQQSAYVGNTIYDATFILDKVNKVSNDNAKEWLQNMAGDCLFIAFTPYPPEVALGLQTELEKYMPHEVLNRVLGMERALIQGRDAYPAIHRPIETLQSVMPDETASYAKQAKECISELVQFTTLELVGQNCDYATVEVANN